MNKTFTLLLRDKNGPILDEHGAQKTLKVNQLATFNRKIDGITFSFVVTHIDGWQFAQIIERSTTVSVAPLMSVYYGVSVDAPAAKIKEAAKDCLNALIGRVGEADVYKRLMEMRKLCANKQK